LYDCVIIIVKAAAYWRNHLYGDASLTKLPPMRGLIASVIAYIVLWLATPKVSFLPGPVLLLLTTIVFMAVQIAIVYFFSSLKMKWWQNLACTLVCIGITVSILLIIASQVGSKTRVANYYGLLRIPLSLTIMFAAAGIGCAVAERVKDRNLLLPVVMFAAYIDFWTVTRGPVAAILQRAPHVAQIASVPIPQAGTGKFTPISLIGPGDFLFMALVFAAVNRLGMNGRRNYWFVFGAMTVGMLAVVLGIVSFLPALIMLAVAAITANWGQFKLTRQEAISTIAVGILLIGSLPIIWQVLAPKEKKQRPAVSKPIRKQ
jgi:hypothetical protein